MIIFDELDEVVLKRLIGRILIGEVKKVNGQKVQDMQYCLEILEIIA